MDWFLYDRDLRHERIKACDIAWCFRYWMVRFNNLFNVTDFFLYPLKTS